MVAIASIPSSTTALRQQRRPAPVLVSVPDLARTPFRVRGRAVATVLLVAVALLAATYLATSPPMRAAGAPAIAGSHVVAEGETMWSIAVDNAPAGEAAGYVEQLVAVNGDARVAPGQRITLPTP